MKDKEKQIEEMEELAQTIYQKLFSNHTRFHFDEMSISRWVAEQSVEIYNKGIEKGSKETAEKFYKKVRKLLKKVDIIVDGDEGLVGYEESAVDKGLTEIAKQFSVEVKE